MKTDSIDLAQIARQALVERGFEPEFSVEAKRELEHLPEPALQGLEDLRSTLWSSIDNDDSRDLDQIEAAQPLPGGVIRVWVGVADVDERVEKSSAIDAHAQQNTTSLYTGVAIFPMLPERLSTDLTSLNPNQDRSAMVVEMDVALNGEVTHSRLFRARVRNHAQLVYESVSSWLEKRGPAPKAVADSPELARQLEWQNEAALRLKKLRHERGALELSSSEARVVKKGTDVVDLAVPEKGRARELIEDFMIAANGVVARFLKEKGRSAIARVVRIPERWPRIVSLAQTLGVTLPAEPDARALSAFLEREKRADPAHFPDLSLAVVKLIGRGEYVLQRADQPSEGHFGLAVAGYSHSTAPNRRFPDLVTHRLVKTAVAETPPAYRDEELAAVASRCSEMEHQAEKVERFMRKVLAAFILRDRIGQVFTGVVTGASAKGTWVRVTQPPAEGRVVRGEKGLDVGDFVKVKLVATVPAKGFIDFAVI